MPSTIPSPRGFGQRVAAEILDLEHRLATLGPTIKGLRAAGHETADATREMDRVRGRLDVLRRIAARKMHH